MECPRNSETEVQGTLQVMSIDRCISDDSVSLLKRGYSSSTDMHSPVYRLLSIVYSGTDPRNNECIK